MEGHVFCCLQGCMDQGFAYLKVQLPYDAVTFSICQKHWYEIEGMIRENCKKEDRSRRKESDS